jgi:adenylylsulfate kinase
MKLSQNDVAWFNGHISKEDREKLHGHPGFVIWFTGLSASGKSTIAHLVEKSLHERGCSTYVFDGDNVRHGLCSDLGFSRKDREENVRRIGEVVRLFVDAGIIVLTAFISPYRADRKRIRSLFNPHEFIEVYTKCHLRVCGSRDKKGIYKRAEAGEIKNFTGISAPYEPPEDPEIVIDSEHESAIEGLQKVLAYIDNLEYISHIKKDRKGRFPMYIQQVDSFFMFEDPKCGR